MHKILIIGRGGREHALAWKMAQSSQVAAVYAAPGSHGMEGVATRVPIDEKDIDALAAFAKRENIALTIVGPEVPLMNGIADRFLAEGLVVFGPKANAAIIEGSKAFFNELMEKYDIPTAKHKIFDNYAAAMAYIETLNPPIVIKADGLAAGKGVIIAQTLNDARQALTEMMQDAKFGQSGATVVIQEYLAGEEFSYIAMVHGENVCAMPISQDHKRVYDGDKGPNTGGMGVYTPVPQIDEGIQAATHNILQNTARAMAKEGRMFTGFLYGGIMATIDGPKVFEFNARLGDPEAEILLPLLKSDLFEAIMSLLRGEEPTLEWQDEAIVGVMLCAKGYPEKYVMGIPIHGLDSLQQDTIVFHCGTGYENGCYTTNGGRVLFIARRAQTLAKAQADVYAEVKKIKCDNLFYRTDIAYKGLRA